jgi:hypothetical protein
MTILVSKRGLSNSENQAFYNFFHKIIFSKFPEHLCCFGVAGQLRCYQLVPFASRLVYLKILKKLGRKCQQGQICLGAFYQQKIEVKISKHLNSM